MKREQAIGSLKGVFTPVVTPFDGRGELDEGGFVANLRAYKGMGLSGVLVAGSTGEAPYLKERERLRCLSLARRVIRPPQLLLAGTGLESTQETIRLSREAIRCGADALLVVTPGYYKPRMDSAALIAHYRAIAGAVSRPILIYSIPQFTGVTIGADAIAALSHHPNIVGLKESSGDLRFIREVIRKSKPGFRVLVGSALIALEGLKAGAAGAVLGPADYAPELCIAMTEAFAEGDEKRAMQLQAALTPLVTDIAVPFGVAGIKAAMDLRGYHGGKPRPPLLPVTAKERKRIAGVLAKARSALDS
jgi:4-hydroxy-2-oxoglutarate aldolase